jgi:prepilin-type N-terminal cleavage/methylation domain-containing protein
MAGTAPGELAGTASCARRSAAHGARAAGQRGYTLVELLLAMAAAGMIAAGLLGVQQTASAAYRNGLALEDAQLRARSALDRMTAELRLAGAYWTGAAGAGPAVVAATTTSIAFMGDVNHDTVNGTAETLTAAGVAAGDTAVTLDATPRRTGDAFNVYANPGLNDFLSIGHGAHREVRQVAAVSGSTLTLATALARAHPAGSIARSVERVTYAFNPLTGALTRSSGGSGADTVVDRLLALSLACRDDADPPAPTLDPARIREIQVSLTADGRDGRRRTLTSSVRLRN